MKTPQLSYLRKVDGGSAGEALGNILTYVCQQFNVARNLNDAQIMVLVPEIMRRFYYLKFDELLYVFREAIAGKWGKNYGHVDAQVVIGWIEAYERTERDALLAREIEEREKAYKLQEQGNAVGVADDNMKRAYWAYQLRDKTAEELRGMLLKYAEKEDAVRLINAEIERRSVVTPKVMNKDQQYAEWRREYLAGKMRQEFEDAQVVNPESE